MFHYTKAALRVGPRILATYFFHIKKWSKHLDKYPRAKRFAMTRKLVGKISQAFNAELIIFGLDNVPETNYCLVCNHMSAFDPIPFMMNSKIPLTFIAKQELKKAPFLPTALAGIEGEFIDRDNLRQSLKVMLRVEDDLKTGEKSWMIFPEGTRVRDQLLPVGDFHHGTFRPAMKAKVPILPAAIYGSFRVFKKKPQFKKYPVFISILKPIMPEDYAGLSTADIAFKVQQAVQREITYHLRPLDHQTMSETKDKHYHFDKIV